jgi:hypothetical protein
MSSGFKEILFNINERLVSVDHNRSQKFKGADVAETLRYMLDVSAATDDLDAGGVVTEFSSLESPLRGEILNGLLVRPAVGSLVMTVDPGVVLALDPDAAADDSNYKYIHDPGLSGTALQFGANASGSTRIDVVECQPTAGTLETATRDVYNNATGTFSPTMVTKAVGTQMTYRVRAGTAGAGWPGTQSGWMPLLVASIPTASTTNDTMTFWDVRPLINDRAYGYSNLGQKMPVFRKSQAYVDAISNAGQARLSGFIEAEFNGRRVGGNMLRGSPGTDNAYVDLKDAANQENAFATPANGYAWLYLAFPFGLPRWARYTDSTSGSRIPRSPRGIPILSTTGPKHLIGTPNSSGIVPPAAWGFSTGILLANALCVGALQFVSSTAQDIVFADNMQRLAGAGLSINATSATLASQTYVVTENTHFPANAKTIFVKISIVINIPATSTVACQPTIDINDASNNGPAARVPVQSLNSANPTGTTNTFPFSFVVEVPIPTKYPTATPGSYNLIHTLNATNIGAAPTLNGTPTAQVVGWRL